MNVKTTISTTEARKRLFDIVDEVSSPAVVYTLTERGRPKAVIMSAEEYESWVETMEVMREFPNLDKDVRETRQAWKTGAWKKWSVYRGMVNGKLVFNDKPKLNVYARTKTKRKKETR
ncbi:MAG: type II toxin-antitoxin system Phd/YefM family antitoxin [bacterium]|nr:type II toxin-antitoxin system Phd/YefM family antitoxin [bacterium]